MANGNVVTLVGNITRDPELRFTNTGQATSSFGLAVNRRWQNRQTQEWEEATSFFDVVCWREMAENAAESLTKGARVIVTGRLDQRSWETPDGDKRSKVEVVADEIGPSIRWATAQVVKNERRGPGDGGPGPSGGPSGGGSGPAGEPQGYGYSEEPFQPWRATTIVEVPPGVPPRTPDGGSRRSPVPCARTGWSGSTTRTSGCSAST
jgi:single-strand DNA-binding protein